MVEVRMTLADDVASRVAAAAADRGVTVEELASQALEAYLANGSSSRRGSLSFLALGEAKAGFSAREAEERLEADGFPPSHSS